MVSKDTFEDFGKKRLKDLLEQGEKPVIIAGFLDTFGNSEITFCSKCGTPVYVRPFILQAKQKHNLKVVCLCCADWSAVKGQLVMDLAKIEEMIR